MTRRNNQFFIGAVAKIGNIANQDPLSVKLVDYPDTEFLLARTDE